MAYNLGVLENALKQVKDRLDSYRLAGQKLVDVKGVLIGSRPIEAGHNILPLIILNPESFVDETTTLAQSGGQKTGTLTLQIRLICEKIMNNAEARYDNNVLFDSTGKGALAYFQNMVDALVFETNSNFNPKMGLALNMMPDFTFNFEETATTVEIFARVELALRYTLGTFSGTTT
jgi:hypothetical protein